jgi:hypothetical protein
MCFTKILIVPVDEEQIYPEDFQAKELFYSMLPISDRAMPFASSVCASSYSKK